VAFTHMFAERFVGLATRRAHTEVPSNKSLN